MCLDTNNINSDCVLNDKISRHFFFLAHEYLAKLLYDILGRSKIIHLPVLFKLGSFSQTMSLSIDEQILRLRTQM